MAVVSVANSYQTSPQMGLFLISLAAELLMGRCLCRCLVCKQMKVELLWEEQGRRPLHFPPSLRPLRTIPKHPGEAAGVALTWQTGPGVHPWCAPPRVLLAYSHVVLILWPVRRGPCPTVIVRRMVPGRRFQSGPQQERAHSHGFIA